MKDVLAKLAATPRLQSAGKAELWCVDLKGGTSEFLGKFETGVRVQPSPDGLRALVSGFFQFESWQDVLILDATDGTARWEQEIGYEAVWRNNSQLICLGDRVSTYDLRTKIKAPLLAPGHLEQFFEKHNIRRGPETPNRLERAGNTILLTDAVAGSESGFTAKLNTNTLTLELLSRTNSFDPAAAASIDSSGRFFFFARPRGYGREERRDPRVRQMAERNWDFPEHPRPSALCARDLQTGRTNVLFDHTGISPVFYRNSLIYERSNAVWKSSIDLKHPVRLFP